jgi:L-amino acid N-acyltransferase YncA
MIRPTSNVGLISKILGKSIDTLPDRTVFLLLEAEESGQSRIIGLGILFMMDQHLAFTDAVVLARYKDDKELQAQLCKEMIQHSFNIGFGKLVALIPDSRKSEMGFFQRGGFKREGVLRNSCKINGVVEHQTVLGVEAWD